MEQLEGTLHLGIEDKQPNEAIVDVKILDEYSFGIATKEYKSALEAQREKHRKEALEITKNPKLCPQLNTIRNYYRRLGNQAI